MSVVSEAPYAALTLAMYVAPTSREQFAFQEMYNNMRAAGESDKAIVLAMCGAVQDGLKHNNWPQKESN